MIQILWILFIIKQAKFLSFGHDSSVPDVIVAAVITARKEVYHNEVMPSLMNWFDGWQSIMIS